MHIVLEENSLLVRLNPLEKLLAFRWSDIRVPRANVVDAESTLPPPTWKQLRIPGTHLPGILKAGSYLTNRGWEFWFLTPRGREHPINISLKGYRYARLVLGAESGVDAAGIKRWIDPNAAAE